MIAVAVGVAAFVVGAIAGALAIVLSLMFWEPWFEDAQDEPNEFTERPQHDLDAAQLGRADLSTLAKTKASPTFSGDYSEPAAVQAPALTPLSFSGLDRNGTHDRRSEVVQ